jgi:predicted amidohydrolase
MPGSSLRVAVAQIESVPGDLTANHRKHREVIDDARAAGVELLVFPELSLTGHGAGAEAPRRALNAASELVTSLAEASAGMRTVFGLIEETTAALFHNTAVMVRDSRVEFVHRKVNLATYGRLEEGKHYAAGRVIETHDLDAPWRAGLLICADLWNPPLVHLAAARGATVLLAPISSALEAVGAEFDNPGGWDVNLRFHAMTYGLPIAMANRVGAEGSLTFWGGSRILDPFGHTLARADGIEEQLVVADLDFEAIRRARWLLPTLRDSNPLLLHAEFTRLVTLPG